MQKYHRKHVRKYYFEIYFKDVKKMAIHSFKIGIIELFLNVVFLL